jgi:hypothetical protein
MMQGSVPPAGSAGTPVVRMAGIRRRILVASAIAAGFLILAGLFFTLRHDLVNRKLNHPGGPEAEIAMVNAREALLMVSGNLNHGLRQAEKIRSVEKAFDELQHFNKFYQYQPIIINQDGNIHQSDKK